MRRFCSLLASMTATHHHSTGKKKDGEQITPHSHDIQRCLRNIYFIPNVSHPFEICFPTKQRIESGSSN